MEGKNMHIKKHHFQISLSALVLSVLLIANCLFPASAKYTPSYWGVAWASRFSILQVNSVGFVIEDPTGDESGHLWGAGEEADGYNSTYNLGNLQEVAFSIYNGTSQKMLITFDISMFYIDFDKSVPFTITNTVTNESLRGTFITKANATTTKEVKMTRSASAYYTELFFFNYYKYSCTADPSKMLTTDDELNILENSFVIDAGETITFSMTVDYSGLFGNNSLYACYSSIQMNATPYNP